MRLASFGVNIWNVVESNLYVKQFTNLPKSAGGTVMEFRCHLLPHSFKFRYCCENCSCFYHHQKYHGQSLWSYFKILIRDNMLLSKLTFFVIGCCLALQLDVINERHVGRHAVLHMKLFLFLLQFPMQPISKWAISTSFNLFDQNAIKLTQQHLGFKLSLVLFINQSTFGWSISCVIRIEA